MIHRSVPPEIENRALSSPASAQDTDPPSGSVAVNVPTAAASFSATWNRSRPLSVGGWLTSASVMVIDPTTDPARLNDKTTVSPLSLS